MNETIAPILLVDDDLDIRDALTDTLESHGFSVVSAANGREALELLPTLPRLPSVILLDLMMPVMDGYRFLEERKQNPAFASIPVAIITAGNGVDKSRLSEMPLTEMPPVVRKPIKVPQLLTLLRDLQSLGGTT